MTRQRQPGDTDLHEAASEGDGGRIAELVARGAPVDARNSHGHTPLALAALFDHVDAVEQLLRAGADPNSRNRDDRTVLFFAGSPAAIRLLVDAGAEVNATDSSGVTALLTAVWDRDVDLGTVQALIEAGGETNRPGGPDGHTPLEAAIRSGDRDLIRIVDVEGSVALEPESGIDPVDAPDSLREFAATRNLDVDVASTEERIETMAEWYRVERAKVISLDAGGDMLLFQWGTSTWRGGDGAAFGFDLSRQFMFGRAGDSEILQLSWTMLYPPSSQTAALGSGSFWCEKPDDLDAFVVRVRASEASAFAMRNEPTRRTLRLDWV